MKNSFEQTACLTRTICLVTSKQEEEEEEEEEEDIYPG